MLDRMQQASLMIGKSTNGALKNTRRATVQSPDRKIYMEDGLWSVLVRLGKVPSFLSSNNNERLSRT
jgi:hypothetical protein